MIPRFVVILFFQVFLPLALGILIPVQFLLHGADWVFVERQLAGGGLVVASMILCFATMADLVGGFSRQELPDRVLYSAWAIFCWGIIGAILLAGVNGMYAPAEMNNGCLILSTSKTGCNDIYPNGPSTWAICYMMSVIIWMAALYSYTHSERFPKT